MYRQGDVLIERVGKLPEREETSDTLLIIGESQNHGHFVEGADVRIFTARPAERSEGGGCITHYLECAQEATLEHRLIDTLLWTEEHAPIILPPGRYRVIRQREYDPYARAIRLVND